MPAMTRKRRQPTPVTDTQAQGEAVQVRRPTTEVTLRVNPQTLVLRGEATISLNPPAGRPIVLVREPDGSWTPLLIDPGEWEIRQKPRGPRLFVPGHPS